MGLIYIGIIVAVLLLAIIIQTTINRNEVVEAKRIIRHQNYLIEEMTRNVHND